MRKAMRIALFPGTFDPVTRGHLDLIQRGADLFDTLMVAVLVNPEKAPLLDEEERVALLRQETAGIRNVEVRAFRGLVTHLALDVGARWILRGLRSVGDLEHEMPMAFSNRLCSAQAVETVFLQPRPEFQGIRSSLVREIARWGGELDPFVTRRVARKLRGHFAARP